MNNEQIVKRLRALKTLEISDSHYVGEYKDWRIDINREEDDKWYIMVFGDNGYAYDGYWRDYSNDIYAAILQALSGSRLYNPTKTDEQTEVKNIYWKCVSEDGTTIISQNRIDALENAERARECGDKAYVRKIAMTQKEFEELDEYD